VGFYELASSLALFSAITAIEQGSLCARNLFSREQFQLRAPKQSSAALFPPAIGGALDQLLENSADRDHSSAPGPGVVGFVEHRRSLFPHHQAGRLLLYNFTLGKHREQRVRQFLAADDAPSLGRHDPPLVLLEDPLQQPPRWVMLTKNRQTRGMALTT
jgi:hypothetical protein